VKVEPESNGIPSPDVKHNHYVTSSMPIA